MFMHVETERVSEDGLRMERWGAILNERGTLALNSYTDTRRETRRHGYKIDRAWRRIQHERRELGARLVEGYQAPQEIIDVLVAKARLRIQWGGTVMQTWVILEKAESVADERQYFARLTPEQVSEVCRLSTPFEPGFWEINQSDLPFKPGPVLPDCPASVYGVLTLWTDA